MFFSIGTAFRVCRPTNSDTHKIPSQHTFPPRVTPKSPREGLPKFHSHHIDIVKMRFLCLPGAYGSSDVSKTMLRCATVLRNTSPFTTFPNSNIDPGLWLTRH